MHRWVCASGYASRSHGVRSAAVTTGRPVASSVLTRSAWAEPGSGGDRPDDDRVCVMADRRAIAISASSGSKPTTSSSTCGWTARSARGKAGLDRRGGVGRGEVHGSRHDRKDALFGPDTEGQVACFVPDKGQRSGGDLARQGAVRRGAHDLQPRPSRREQRRRRRRRSDTRPSDRWTPSESSSRRREAWRSPR